MSEKIAFIGVGNMGNPMAENLLKAGNKIKVFDVSKDMLAKAKKKNLETVDSIEDLINHEISIVVTMLPEGKHSKEIYLGDNGVINKVQKNCLLIDCSTIDIETSKEIGKAANDKGILMIDAPVSGGVMGAQKATLNIMVGGSKEAFDKALPFLKVMGKNIYHAIDGVVDVIPKFVKDTSNMDVVFASKEHVPSDIMKKLKLIDRENLTNMNLFDPSR